MSFLFLILTKLNGDNVACIIKLPTSKSKGVISLTNIEYSGQVKDSSLNKELINSLKENWIFCYHPNWEDHGFIDNGVFDCVISVPSSFSFSEKSTGNKVLINTCSNRMSPSGFHSVDIKDKLWDFCHVSRYQESKNIEGFFHVIKKTFIKKPNLTGILIISVANNKEMQRIRDYYEKLFTQQETKQFEFITLSYNLPFPLSKKILAHFYNYSKVTLNTHLNEPHGRVIGYALASGLPVVGYKNISEMVNTESRCEPYFYLSEINDENCLSQKLFDAISYTDKSYDSNLMLEIARSFSELPQSAFLKEQLISNFNLDESNWNLHELDSRLSTHYLLEKSSNTFDASVFDLLNYLNSINDYSEAFDEVSIVNDVISFSKSNVSKFRRFLVLLDIKKKSYKKRYLNKLNGTLAFKAIRLSKRIVFN